MMLSSVNPATEDVLAKYETIDASQLQDILKKADRGSAFWQAVPLVERLEVIARIADVLEHDTVVRNAAAIITAEMGKPLVQAIAEVRKCASVCRYVVEEAATVFASRTVDAGFGHSTVEVAPLGTVFSIMPWNFPFWQFFRFAAPALAAGNSIILKHAPTTWGSALEALGICHMAGVPDDVLQAAIIDIDLVEEAIASPHVHAVTFTGSTRAGSTVAALSGRYVKKSVLELGGSDPYLVLDDANLDVAVEACVAGRLVNTGQSCVAAKRWIVDDALYDDFLERATDAMQRQVVGHPAQPATTLGPLARADLRDLLRQQVEDTIAAGGRYVGGGQLLPDRGFFVEPGIVEARPGMAAFDQELFGPVACLSRATSDDHAVMLANASMYGLGAAVFTSNPRRADSVAARIRSGMVFVNTFVRSDARLPFGGIAMSGYGRELGHAGMMEFVNIRTLVHS